MSAGTVGILGFICIIAIVITLFQSKTLPSIAFIVFPSILAMTLVAGGYYKFGDIGKLIKAGFGSTAPTAALFVFSVLYFGIMSDTGMFDVIIGKLMGLIGNSVIGVTVMTAVIALIAHLDGGVFSYKVKLVKPEPAIYERICTEYRLLPGECLFMDDSRVNIAMARKCGLNAVHFVSYEKTAPEIESFLTRS